MQVDVLESHAPAKGDHRAVGIWSSRFEQQRGDDAPIGWSSKPDGHLALGAASRTGASTVTSYSSVLGSRSASINRKFSRDPRIGLRRSS
jgi:hypothetical protein